MTVLNLAESLRDAVKQCSDRGLLMASRWAAEQLVGLPTIATPATSRRRKSLSTHYASNNEEDVFLYAKTLFDTKEFSRAAFSLAKCHEPKSVFLRLYSRLLAAESHCGLQNESYSQGQLDQDLKRTCIEIERELLQRMASQDKITVGSSPRQQQSQAGNVDSQGTDGFLLYLLGVVCAKLKKPTAKDYLVQAVVTYPYNWSAWTELAACFSHFEEVASLLPKLPADFMTNAFHIHLANQLHQRNELTLVQINEMAKECPNSRFVQLQRGIYHHNARTFDEAEAVFDEIVQLDPFIVDSMDVYSNVLYCKKLVCKLSSLANRLSLTNKYRPETCMAIANYYSLKADHEKAIKYFERAFKLDNSYSPALTLMGHEYLELSNGTAAIEVYRKAIDLNACDFRSWYGLAQAYDLLKLPLHALYYYQRAATIRPYDGRMWNALAESFERVNQVQEAIKCLKRALLSIDEISPDFMGRIAKLYERLYEQTEKKEYLEVIAYYYRKYLEVRGHLQESLDEDKDEFSDEACLFLAEYYKGRGEWKIAEEYTGQILHLEEGKILQHQIEQDRLQVDDIIYSDGDVDELDDKPPRRRRRVG